MGPYFNHPLLSGVYRRWDRDVNKTAKEFFQGTTQQKLDVHHWRDHLL